MSSFSSEVKNELARRIDDAACCRAAELAALMRMGGTVSIGRKMAVGINFTTENAAVARKALTLLKEGFQLKTEVMVSRGRRLKKNNSYLIKAIPSADVAALLEKLGIMQGESLNVAGDSGLLRKVCCRCAYLRGAFLGGGSVNRPEGDYHLELVTGSYQFAAMLSAIGKKFDLPMGLTDRKNDYVVYLKDGDSIADFLGIIGVGDALTEFESARNLKEVRNQVNRLVNCETANLQKTVNASCRQVERIKLIETRLGFENLSAALTEAAKLRLAYPEATLQELTAYMGNTISKSGLNHRLRKLEKMAAALTEGEEYEVKG